MKRFLISLFALLTIGGIAAEPIGKVIAVDGAFKAAGTKQPARNLLKDSLIYLGDLLSTGDGAKGQVQFTDGTLILLVSETQYLVDSYDKSNFKAKLQQGGIRFLTGSISKSHPENVELGTPVVTIGFRGTQGEARLVNGKLFAGCTGGALELQNKAGSLAIGPKQKTQFSAIYSQDENPLPLGERPSELSLELFVPPSGGLMFNAAEQLQPRISAPVSNGVCQQEDSKQQPK